MPKKREEKEKGKKGVEATYIKRKRSTLQHMQNLCFTHLHHILEKSFY
jgi:hypothetical protein